MSKKISVSQYFQTVYDLIKLIILILFIANSCACGFHLIHFIEREVYNM